MNMVQLPVTLRRWWWVLVAVVAVCAGAASLHVLTTHAPYQARVMLQLTAPRDVDASVLDTGNPSTSTLRDDLTLVQNDFTTVVGTAEVRRRTAQQLGLSDSDAQYTVSVSPVGDSNFVVVLVSSPNPKLVQAIANAHVAQAIQFLGELRAKPANDTKDLLAAQLQAAKAKLSSVSPSTSGAAAAAEAQDAQTTYQTLLDKYTQASLVADNAARASYIQVAAPATSVARQSLLHRLVMQDALAIVGALGLGALILLALDQLPRRALPLARRADLGGADATFVPHETLIEQAVTFHPRSKRNGHRNTALPTLEGDGHGGE